MGIYNCEATLERAVSSIINQTFSDWEFIICDDASTDNSLAIANAFAQKDSRIKVLHNEKNIGCNIVLNRCIDMAQGEYIAIMDSDDISLPKRLERQVAILDKNPQYGIVGTRATHFDEKGEYMTLPIAERPRPIDLAFQIPHLHPTCMIRTGIMREIGGYEPNSRMHRVEDYYMMVRIYQLGYRGYNLQEILFRYFDNKESYRRRTWQNRINEVYTYYHAYRLLKIPYTLYPRLIRPLLVGILPPPLYFFLHRRPWLK